MRLHHEMQSTFSVLGEIFVPGKHFYQLFIFEKQTGSGRNTNKFQTKKIVVNDFFLPITLLAIMPKLTHCSNKLTI